MYCQRFNCILTPIPEFETPNEGYPLPSTHPRRSTYTRRSGNSKLCESQASVRSLHSPHSRLGTSAISCYGVCLAHLEKLRIRDSKHSMVYISRGFSHSSQQETAPQCCCHTRGHGIAHLLIPAHTHAQTVTQSSGRSTKILKITWGQAVRFCKCLTIAARRGLAADAM